MRLRARPAVTGHAAGEVPEGRGERPPRPAARRAAAAMNLSAALYSAQTFGAQYACESPRPKGKSREKTAPRDALAGEGTEGDGGDEDGDGEVPRIDIDATTRPRATRTRRVAPTRADAVREEVRRSRGRRTRERA